MRLGAGLALGVFAASACAVALACGDEPAASAPPVDAGPEATTESPVDAGDDGSTDAAGDPFGIVLLIHHAGSLGAHATFAAPSIGGGHGFGVVAREGACRVFESATSILGTAPLVTPPRIVVSGENLYEGDLVLEPDGPAASQGARTMVLFYGKSLRVVSEGNDVVPAFDEVVQAPADPFKRTAPTDDALATIVRSQDLTVEWEAAAGFVNVVILIEDGRQLSCDFPAETGSGVVPKALLGELPAGEANIGFTLSSTKRAAKNGYRYEVQVEPVAIGIETTLE